MEINLDYKPSDRQKEFHSCPARFRLYGGAMGGGKSVALCMEGLKLALKYPGSYGYIARKTFESLRKTTMKTFFEFTPKELIARHNKSEHLVSLVNGSEIQFGDLENDDKLKSLNLAWFGIDEASEISKNTFLLMSSRLRQRIPKIDMKYYGFLTSNPAPCWLRDDFVKHPQRDYVFIPALPKENPYLPHDYVERLYETSTPEWSKRYLEGDWGTFEGQIYCDFNRDRNLVTPFDIPFYWNKYRTIDLGSENPTVCLWIAVNPEGDVYVYREYYASSLATEEHAETITMASKGEKYIGTVFDHHGLGKQLITDYNRLGVRGFQAKERTVISGVERVKELLRPQGEENKSKLYVFDNCINTIREFESYQWDTRKNNLDMSGREKPLDKDNDTMDALKNWVMAFYYVKTSPKEEYKEKVKKEMDKKKLEKTYKVSEITGY